MNWGHDQESWQVCVHPKPRDSERAPCTGDLLCSLASASTDGRSLLLFMETPCCHFSTLQLWAILLTDRISGGLLLTSLRYTVNRRLDKMAKMSRFNSDLQIYEEFH